MRCPDCSKMVSFDEPQATVESEEVSDDGQVNIEVRLVLPCAECGQELKETTFSFEHDLEHTCDPVKALENPDKSGFELQVDDPETTEDFKPKVDAKGKPIPTRYQKHFYGVTVTGTATCNKCGEEIPFTLEDEIQSSGMDELV